MNIQIVQIAFAVLVLTAVHPVSALITRNHKKKRTLSFCAGIALAYVFLHLLPELSNLQSELQERRAPDHSRLWFEEHVYILALAGLLIFQVIDGIGRAEYLSKLKLLSFRAEVLFFSLYSALIGYLVITSTGFMQPTILLTIAFAAHFFGTDIELAKRYTTLYVKKGWIILSAATMLGMLAGFLINVNDIIHIAGFSFLAGGILINTLRTELPQPQHTKFLFLLSGIVFYSMMILTIYYITRQSG